MARLDDCPCSGLTLDKMIRPAVLTVLAREPLHGYLIVRRIAKLRILRGGKPDATGVYRALGSMQKTGLVKARWVLSRPGPAKRRYRLTRSGKACLRRWVRTLGSYERAVGELLRLARGAVRRRKIAAKPARRTRRRAA
jgi:DNA-binding PadR family transcriptional regulator